MSNEVPGYPTVYTKEHGWINKGKWLGGTARGDIWEILGKSKERTDEITVDFEIIGTLTNIVSMEHYDEQSPEANLVDYLHEILPVLKAANAVVSACMNGYAQGKFNDGKWLPPDVRACLRAYQAVLHRQEPKTEDAKWLQHQEQRNKRIRTLVEDAVNSDMGTDSDMDTDKENEL